MADTRIALLPDRGVVSVMGEDAEKLLQGVITNDMGLLTTQPALHAGLLTPQGKILFDFFVVRAADGFLLETARDKAAALADRLKLYKLRAKADIRDVSSDYSVAAIWGGTYEPHGRGKAPLLFADPRLAAMGARELVTIGSDWALANEEADSATQDEYHAHRIGLGVPEGGKDYAFGDTFPHEALFDQLAGVSFTKGCYVGQEVVARMQNRGTVRKRVVPVNGAGALPAPATAIVAGGVEIGTLGSVAGERGLALIRLDRAAEIADRGEMLRAGDVPVRIAPPSWATFSLASTTAGTPA
ncbi:MAG TPA: folate-binding protein [Hyphomicrobium sp.]|nr:folate-binding protein [Hyphomicrobium sp.]